MSKKIVVAVQTYRRPKYLHEILESFFTLNAPALDRFLFVGISLDNNRPTQKVLTEFGSHFQWISKVKNKGCAAGWRTMMHRILLEMKDTEHILYLQDDWASKEPLYPYLDELLEVMDKTQKLGQIRLREKSFHVCKKHRINKKLITYTPVSEHVSLSNAHFTFNPTLMPAAVVRYMISKDIHKEKAGMIAFHWGGFRSGQLNAECFHHIGTERAITITPKGPRWIK